MRIWLVLKWLLGPKCEGCKAREVALRNSYCGLSLCDSCHEVNTRIEKKISGEESDSGIWLPSHLEAKITMEEK